MVLVTGYWFEHCSSRQLLASSRVSNDCWRTGTSSQQPATSSQQPAASSQQPATSNQQPAMPDYGDLTDLQLMIMSVLWSEREATIGTIHEQLNTQTPVARKTVAMILSRLEQRRLVSHRLDGREGVYKPRVAKQNVLRSRMASLLGALFVGQPRLTGAHALDPADVRTGDVEKMAAMIRQLERDVKKED